MYSECVSCSKIGVTCKGPDIKEMTSAEILEWCKKRKTFLHMSNAKLAEMSQTPKGTLDRIFSGEHLDFKFETIRRIFKALVGGTVDFSCQDAPVDKNAEETIKRLRTRLDREEEEYRNELHAARDEIKTLKTQLARERNVIAVMGFLLALSIVAVAIGFMV